MSELTTLFQNTADAIRSKTGDTAAMQASQFPAKIQGISVGISQDDADARYLQLSGGTMTGPLTLSGAPASDLQAATKKYVDDSVATIEDSTLIFQGTSSGMVGFTVTPLEMSKFKAIRYIGTADSRGYLDVSVGLDSAVNIMPYGSAPIGAKESRIIDIPFTANGQSGTNAYSGVACLAGLNDTSPIAVKLYDGVDLYVITSIGTVKIYGLK